MGIKELLHVYIGKAIVAKRRECGMTQTELAESIGMSRTSFTNIEAGRQRTGILTLYQVARTLNCEVSELLPPMSDKVFSSGQAALDRALLKLLEEAIMSDA